MIEAAIGPGFEIESTTAPPAATACAIDRTSSSRYQIALHGFVSTALLGSSNIEDRDFSSRGASKRVRRRHRGCRLVRPIWREQGTPPAMQSLPYLPYRSSSLHL
jgi:hypothetical protein